MKALRLPRFFLSSGTSIAGAALALAGVTSLVAGCGDGDTRPNRLDVAARKPPKESDDEWLRKQQRLTIKVETLDPVTGEKRTTSEEKTVGEALASVQDACYEGGPASYCPAPNLCEAKTLLAIATAQSDPVRVTAKSGDPRTYVFDNVTTSNAAEFAAFAADKARIAVDSNLRNLATTNPHCKPNGVWESWAPQAFAGGVVEAYYLGRAAYDRAIEANLAVADAARSSTSSPTEAATRSLLLEKFSRSAAAHLLVGGDDGILGSKTRGYCAGPALSPKAQSALQLLRDAAPNPAFVLDSHTGIQDLLTSSSTSGGPVRQRLAAFHRIKALGWDPIAQDASATPAQSLESYYDLDEKDFSEAREYLQQELSVFNRASKALLPAVNGFQPYAGTAGSSVSEAPPAAWAARARYLAAAQPYYGSWPLDQNGNALTSIPPNLENYHTPPLDTFIGETYARINQFINTSTDSFSAVIPADPADQKEVFGVLGSILMGKEYQGAIELFVPYDRHSIRTTAHGYKVADKVRVVVGEDGLRCAVQGSIEGAACGDPFGDARYGAAGGPCWEGAQTLSCLTLALVNTPDAAADPKKFGTASFVSKETSLGYTAVTNLIDTKTRVYFVKLKDPTLPEEPGSYESLAGATIGDPSSTIIFGAAFPVVPSIEARAAELLAPNRKNCAEQEVDCLGLRTDARLPLEDELTDDGNGFENSWKHYLTLARQAADETALLGREFRDAKLNQLQGAAAKAARREEQRQAAGNALQEVQNLCGTALDTNKLLDYLSLSSNKKLGGALTLCPTGQNTFGMCPVDVYTLPPSTEGLDTVELKRLKDCMDESTVTNVTLGDRKFCIYGAGNEICPSWAPCYSQVTNGSCPNPSNPPASFWRGEVQALGYYKNPEGSSSTGGENCKKFRIARGTHDAQALSELVSSGVFNKDRLKDRLGQLGFKAGFGSFITVTEDKATRFSSGSATLGRAPGWPWAIPAAGCTGGGTGLFCQVLGSTPTAAQIGAFNERAYLAAYAAAAALEEGLEVTYPSQYLPSATPCDGKTYQTEYHIGSALIPSYATPMPVWTCEGPLWGSQAPNGVKYTRAVQPRSTSGTTPWILPNGSILPASSGGGPLNFWGTGAPFCARYVAACMGGSCDTYDTECTWGPLARVRPAAKTVHTAANGKREGEVPYTQQELNSKVWGGLSAQSLEPGQGLIYEALKGASDANAVLFVGGAMNNFLSDKGIQIRGMGLSQFTPTDPVGPSNAVDQQLYYNVPLNVASVLDGLELLCELDRTRSGAAVAGATLDLTTVDDAAEAIRRLADAINLEASNVFFVHVPKVAADALGESGPTGAFPGLSGDMGEAVSNLRQAFVSTQHAYPIIANSLRSLSTGLQSLKTQLEINAAQRKLVDYDTLSAVLSEVTSCALATSNGVNVFTSFGSSAAIACANSAAQIAIAVKKSGVQADIIAGNDQLARLSFIDRMSQDATALQAASISLMEARETVSASLSRIDGFKKRAKLAVARALYLASYQSQEQVEYDTAVGSITAVAQQRFDQSLRNAKLMSWYAKRAIEQKLGVSLRDLRDDLPLVQAPARWEGEACTYGGFQDLANINASPSSGPVTEPAEGWVAKYGDGFIGDYVNKLENFVESYRLTQNFHEGKDTAVVSLRDDVANVKAECTTPSRNLLHSAGDLQSSAWAARNCDPVMTAGVSVSGINCIAAAPMNATSLGLPIPDLAVKGLAGSQDAVNGYTLQFGDGKNCDVNDSGGCGWKPGSALSQIISLLPGRYRLSWYTRDDGSAPYTNGAKKAIVILRGTGSLTDPIAVNSLDAPSQAPSPFVYPREGSGPDWKRASMEFKVIASGEYEIGFGVPTGSRPTAAQPVTIGAPMLEAISDGRQTLLGSFEATDADGMATIPNCQDSDGSMFRLKNWRRECARLCSDGFSTNCKNGPEECYHEFTFGVSQAALQNGKLMSYSGFARGNFNYRIDTLGLNFVGTGIRDCADVSNPTTCSTAGFVPYSLQHNGPFYVRNRAGDDFQALLFDGRIEHARGLALERYFTNPISSSDRELMSEYLRSEFTGRPLDGNFTLRVWDSQGFDFSSIQDVQLILNYRYWTAFN